MKALLLSLLATLVGIAMVAGGVYGVIEDVSGPDDDSASASTTTSSVPSFAAEIPSISPSSNECDDVEARDLRLTELDNRRFKRAGDETGAFRVDLICNGETIVLPVRMSGLKAQETTTYFAWLVNDLGDAEQVGTLIGSSGKGVGSITIGPDVDTTQYDELVITRVPFGKQERRPRKIVFRTQL